jgi:hypothetical protein
VRVPFDILPNLKTRSFFFVPTPNSFPPFFLIARTSSAHIFVDKFPPRGSASNGVEFVSQDDHHHLSSVLRLRAGERITVSDGSGSFLRKFELI